MSRPRSRICSRRGNRPASRKIAIIIKIAKGDIPALRLFATRATCEPFKSASLARADILKSQAAEVASLCAGDGERLASAQKTENKEAALTSLKDLQSHLACEKLRPEVAEAIKLVSPAEKQINTPEQVKAAQIELHRVGCFDGNPSGNLNRSTKAALRDYSQAKQTDKIESIDDALVASLKSEPIAVCKPEPDVADAPHKQKPVAEKPSVVAKPHAVASRHTEDEEEPAPRRKAERHIASPAPAPLRHASARVARSAPAPTASSGGGGGRASQAIGVGF